MSTLPGIRAFLTFRRSTSQDFCDQSVGRTVGTPVHPHLPGVTRVPKDSFSGFSRKAFPRISVHRRGTSSLTLPSLWFLPRSFFDFR